MRALKSRPAGETERPSSKKVLEDLTSKYSAEPAFTVAQHAGSANPSDVALAILRKSAAEFGLTLCCRCQRCNAVLWNSRSVGARLGPVCRKRVPS